MFWGNLVLLVGGEEVCCVLGRRVVRWCLRLDDRDFRGDFVWVVVLAVFSSMVCWSWLWLWGYWRGVDGGDHPVVGGVIVFKVCEDLALVW